MPSAGKTPKRGGPDLPSAFGSPIPQPTEWHHIGNEIDATMIFARADFVGVHRKP
jgi:hypothetical protein